MNAPAKLATLFAAVLFSTGAYADSEHEANDSIPMAQAIDASSGSVSVDAMMGSDKVSSDSDVDFYSFHANAGDVVDIDIDNGYSRTDMTNTVLAVFSSRPGNRMLRFNDNARPDPGSESSADARIDKFFVPESGEYIVGVSTYPRYFTDGGTSIVLRTSRTGAIAPGDYTLVISGVTPAVQQISMNIRPGSNELVKLNPRSKGKIPVAILGSAEFDVTTLDSGSLTFGATGSEQSLSKCAKNAEDKDGDGFADLMCHFDNQAANFAADSVEAVLRGKTQKGAAVEARAPLKVLPVK